MLYPKLCYNKSCYKEINVYYVMVKIGTMLKSQFCNLYPIGGCVFISGLFFSAEKYLDIRLIQLLNVLKDFISKHIYIVSFNYLQMN